VVCRFFAVMPWGRVGSNLIMSLIGQADVPKKLNSERFNQLKTAEEQSAWLEEFYEVHGVPALTLIGSKQSVLSTRDIAGLERFLLIHNIKVIRMRRDNHLKAAISQMRAEEYAKKTLAETGKARWAVRKGDSSLGRTYLDPDILLQRISVMQNQQNRMMAVFSSLECLDIEYEEINTDLSVVYNRVVRFLGFPPKAMSVSFIKATPDDLRSGVSNFADIERALAGTPFERYLPVPSAGQSLASP
jgi:hypothetical protein